MGIIFSHENNAHADQFWINLVKNRKSQILTAETSLPIFIDQLYACKEGYQEFLNLSYLSLVDESVSEIVKVLNNAMTQVKQIRISDLTFRKISDPILKMFAEYVSYVQIDLDNPVLFGFTYFYTAKRMLKYSIQVNFTSMNYVEILKILLTSFKRKSLKTI